MRRFRSISDYLSLGAGPYLPRGGDAAQAARDFAARERLYGPYPTADVARGRRPFEQRTVLSAERLTVAHLREAAASCAAGRIPPIPNTGERQLHGYIDKADGGLVIVKTGTRPEDIADLGELVWNDPDPAAEGFGPYYEVSMPPADMTALCGDPEFQAGEAAGEFRVAGKGRILVRPPREET